MVGDAAQAADSFHFLHHDFLRRILQNFDVWRRAEILYLPLARDRAINAELGAATKPSSISGGGACADQLASAGAFELPRRSVSARRVGSRPKADVRTSSNHRNKRQAKC